MTYLIYIAVLLSIFGLYISVNNLIIALRSKNKAIKLISGYSNEIYDFLDVDGEYKLTITRNKFNDLRNMICEIIKNSNLTEKEKDLNISCINNDSNYAQLGYMNDLLKNIIVIEISE